MSKVLQIKKPVNVHSSQNNYQLNNPIKCLVCLYSDKRKTHTYKTCRSKYFHLKLHEKENLNYHEKNILIQEYDELQEISDKILGVKE